jgi:hypothetical protein
MSHLDFKKNYNWQEKYYEEFKEILHSIGFEDVAYTGTLQDIYEGCDVIADGVSIAIRIRKMHYRVSKSKRLFVRTSRRLLSVAMACAENSRFNSRSGGASTSYATPSNIAVRVTRCRFV